MNAIGEKFNPQPFDRALDSAAIIAGLLVSLPEILAAKIMIATNDKHTILKFDSKHFNKKAFVTAGVGSSYNMFITDEDNVITNIVFGIAEELLVRGAIEGMNKKQLTVLN